MGKVDAFYDSVYSREGVVPSMRNYAEFVLDKHGKLRLKNYPDVDLMKADGSAYAIKTLTDRNHLGGIENFRTAFRAALNFSDYMAKKIPAKASSTRTNRY